MPIRFKCPHCKKPLAVKDHLAGKKAACPVCKQILKIPAPVSAPAPAPAPADLEAFAAEALAEKPAEEKAPDEAASKTIDFACPYCDEELHFGRDMAGKQTPCPECRRIVKVPVPEEKRGDWRDLVKKGPSAALVNLPEQLDGAWGTEAKTRAGREALEEAGAIAEAEVAPLGVGGWIKRVFKWTLVLGAAAGLVLGGLHSRQVKREKDSVSEAVKYVGKDSTLEPFLKAEIHRVLGEFYVLDDKANEAHKHFVNARSLIDAKGKGDKSVPAHEQDLFLAALALAQVELAGVEPDTLGKLPKRLPWRDVQVELQRTLERMRTAEGKSAAVRDLATRLIARDKVEVAVGLAASLANPSAAGARSPVFAQFCSLLLFRKEQEQLKKHLKETDPLKVDPIARVAYAEGYARKGDFAEALKYVKTPERTQSLARLEAGIAAAAVVLAEKGPGEALPFVQAGLAALNEMKKGTAPPWSMFQLVRVGLRTEAAAEMKILAKQLPPSYEGRVDLEILEADLSKASGPVPISRVDEVSDKEPVFRALAWEMIARHNARTNAPGEVKTAAEDIPQQLRPFIHAGLAVGQRELRK